VGATCTETGKYLFWGKEGREFDLVIIDEVSKATFPELLMPMLLGKQIVLVGDHQQLPPTFRLGEGELTLEEIDDKESIKQRLNKFETLVTTSYFREMFEKAIPDLKSRLLTQYRMHPTIMNAINQFYPPGYKLECGIYNPDENRKNDYLIEGKDGALTPKNSHLIWVDTSEILINGNKYQNFEKRESGKYTSRYNEFEVQVIEKILISLNKQFEATNKRDSPAQDIAIISFYAGQVRKLRTMADKLKNSGHLRNIKYRIGTVDRFQGMERSIVIVSLVSSPHKSGPTLFVKEFRRINVAFSRAQSLLIIVGSKRTFEDVDIEIYYDNGEISRRRSYNEIITTAETGINGYCYLKGYDVV
jgi:superfamily I DNA and/or RNA helicase